MEISSTLCAIFLSGRTQPVGSLAAPASLGLHVAGAQELFNNLIHLMALQLDAAILPDSPPASERSLQLRQELGEVLRRCRDAGDDGDLGGGGDELG